TFRLLLVRAKPAPHDWVLPKGHIENGETPDEAAAREVREEAGVDALPLTYLGHLEYDSPKGEHVRAAIFLMQFMREVPAVDNPEIRWCSTREALRITRFEQARVLIRSAVRAIPDHVHATATARQPSRTASGSSRRKP